MSGVYIKGMEMPENCSQCQLVSGYLIFREEDCSDEPIGGYHCRVRRLKTLEHNHRPSYCPLVEVPDHGDLIDRDEVGAWIDGWHTKNEYYHPYSKGKTMPTSEVVDLVKQVPAVIPAERSEE